MSKKSFGLISILILVLIFSYLSINIIQNQTFSSKIDKLKYLHLQANIHLINVKQYINSHNNSQINSYILSDDRFDLNIQIKDINISSKIYHIYLKSKYTNNIRIYNKLIK